MNNSPVCACPQGVCDREVGAVCRDGILFKTDRQQDQVSDRLPGSFGQDRSEVLDPPKLVRAGAKIFHPKHDSMPDG